MKSLVALVFFFLVALLYNNVKAATPKVFPQCKFKWGDGQGGTEKQMPGLYNRESDCTKECYRYSLLKQGRGIMGATWSPYYLKCYCEYNMKEIVASTVWKSCWFIFVLPPLPSP